MKQLENKIRKIYLDGLKWENSRLEPVAFGIHKLQINAIICDDKIPSIDG